MQVDMICYQVFCGCTILASVLGHTLSNTLLDRTEEMNNLQTLKCNSPCPFGFVSDVEGDLTCICYDPCSMILCLQGTVCVAEMPKECEIGHCRAKTTCKAVDIGAVQTRRKEDHLQDIEIPPHMLNDDPKLWWLPGNLCSQSLPHAAVTCRHQRRRWHFNSMTGKCERFTGCESAGNNFARKRFCKEQCRYAYIEKRDRVRAMMKPEVEHADCSLNHLSEDVFNCDNKAKRWYFNSRTQKCEKFIGCDTKGNNFSRKSDCKSTCLAKTKQFLQLKEKHLQESSAR